MALHPQGMEFDWRVHEGAEAVCATGEPEGPDFYAGAPGRLCFRGGRGGSRHMPLVRAGVKLCACQQGRLTAGAAGLSILGQLAQKIDSMARTAVLCAQGRAAGTSPTPRGAMSYSHARCAASWAGSGAHCTPSCPAASGTRLVGKGQQGP